jgi:hypothetical protein
VFVVENLLTKDLKAAHPTRLRFYQDQKLNVTAELAQAAEHNDHELYIVSKILEQTPVLPPGPLSRCSYVSDSRYLIVVSSLPHIFYTISSHWDMHIY